MVCVTSKASDQPAHTRVLIEHRLEFLSLKEGCTGSSESTRVETPLFGNHMSRLNRSLFLCHRMWNYSIFCLLCFISIGPLRVEGFLDVCEAPVPCQCLGDSINCNNYGMPTVPAFNLSKHYSMVYLNLQVYNLACYIFISSIVAFYILF